MKKVLAVLIVALFFAVPCYAAFSHIYFNQSTQYGGLIRSSLYSLESGRNTLNQVLGAMTKMIDGDGSDATQFNEVTNRFGFADNASAKAAWDELNSLASKLNTDGQVTSLNAALIQAFDKFR